MYGKILVPIDGGGPAKAALQEMVKIASDRTPRIRLLHIVDLQRWKTQFPDGSVGDNLANSRREAGQQCLSEAKQFLAEHDVACETTLIESHGETAADKILAAAGEWPADLIVMGTHGRKGLGRLVLGSDAAEVVRQANVPVLLVRDRTAKPAVQEIS